MPYSLVSPVSHLISIPTVGLPNFTADACASCGGDACHPAGSSGSSSAASGSCNHDDHDAYLPAETASIETFIFIP